MMSPRIAGVIVRLAFDVVDAFAVTFTVPLRAPPTRAQKYAVRTPPRETAFARHVCWLLLVTVATSRAAPWRVLAR